MLAEFEGYTYIANVNCDTVTLVTFDKNKKLEGFEAKRDYYKNVVKLDDSRLESIYDIHYWVKYTDCIEKSEIWNIDEGRAVGFLSNIENNEVVINVDHNAKDSSWTQYDKYAASKKIKLTECAEYWVEKIFFKKNGRLVEKNVEKIKVSLETLKASMIGNRRNNL